jgi:hypothetical protein
VSQHDGFVFNADAMFGVSDAVTSLIKVTLTCRFDGYWNALRGFDSGCSENPDFADRSGQI